MLLNKYIAKVGLQLITSRPNPTRYFYRMTCLWGLFLVSPFSLFDGAGFVVMRQYAPKEIWGLIIFLVGYKLKWAALSGKTLHIRDSLFGVMIC